jgi:hypothetical protein
MAVRTELRLRLPNSPGALARVLGLLDADQVRVLALSLETTGLVHLVVNNPSRAVAALRRGHLASSEHDVIWTTVAERSVPSVLSAAAAAGVNLEYAYSASAGADAMVALVLGVADAQRAASTAGL